MLTINQLLRQKRKIKKQKSIKKAPQLKGTCKKIYIKNPKKPNSASRKIAQIQLTNGKLINAYIPGEGHDLDIHGIVLIQGARIRDLPGIQYRLIRGKYDLNGVMNRKQSRSKYGTKKEKN